MICLVVLEASSVRFLGTVDGFKVVFKLLSFDFAFGFSGDFVFGTSGGTFSSSFGVFEAAFGDFSGFFASFRGVFDVGAGMAACLTFSFSEEGGTAGSPEGLRGVIVVAFEVVCGGRELDAGETSTTGAPSTMGGWEEAMDEPFGASQVRKVGGFVDDTDTISRWFSSSNETTGDVLDRTLDE